LRRTILCLAQIGHRSKQPDTGDYQHNEKAKHHRVLDGAIAVIIGRFGSGRHQVI